MEEAPAAFTPDLLGIILSTYYGGRAEVRIRRQIARVLYCDFRSMYPTVCTLMGLWRFVIAQGVAYADATDDAKACIEQADLAALQDRSFWRQLPVLVQVLPDADILPVRAAYQPPNRTIGLNHLTARFPLWYTLADCIASKLLTGKAPKIARAIRFTPLGVQPNLKPIKIGGHDAYTIDPAKDDLFKRVIELRGEIKREVAAARDRGDLNEAERLDGYQTMLKLLANATSYGIYAEMNVQSHDEPHEIQCYGIDGQPFVTRSKSVEETGPQFHPLIATLITGAARLMLAIAERLATEHDLGWAFCDTDSLAIARSNGIADAAFIERARTITDWFDQLSPYDDDEPLFKTEAENFRLDGGKVIKGEHVPLYAYAISAKRYALFNIGADRQPILRKALAHGLGHLVEPYSEADAPACIPKPVISLSEMGIRRWHYDLWYQIVSAALTGQSDQVDLSRLPNMHLAAASRYSLSTTALAHWFDRYNKYRDTSERVRAFNFMLSFQLSGQRVNVAIAEGILDKAIKKDPPAPVAPFDTNIEIASRSCFDRKTAAPVPVGLLATYEETLAGYYLHSEAKFENAEAFDRGVTERRHIRAVAVEYIGKEANRWEEQYHVGEMPEAQIVYGLSPEGLEQVLALVREGASAFGVSAVAEEAGMSRQRVTDVLEGRAAPRPRTVVALMRAATALKPRAKGEICLTG